MLLNPRTPLLSVFLLAPESAVVTVRQLLSLRLELFADGVGDDLGPVDFGAGDGQQPSQGLESRIRPENLQ